MALVAKCALGRGRCRLLAPAAAVFQLRFKSGSHFPALLAGTKLPEADLGIKVGNRKAFSTSTTNRAKLLDALLFEDGEASTKVVKISPLAGSASKASKGSEESSDTPAKLKVLSEVEKAKEKEACVLIDGDIFGPSRWPDILNCIKQYRNVAEVKVYIFPHAAENPDWVAAIAEIRGGEIIPVPRYTKGNKDPNDIAIAAGAATAGHQGKCVVLAVSDMDFVALADILVKQGADVIAALPPQMPGLHSLFERVGAKAVAFLTRAQLEHTSQGALWKWIMSGDGSCKMQRITSKDKDGLFEKHDLDWLTERLVQLKYLDSVSDPLLPAIVKAFVENKQRVSCNIDELTVLPLALAYRDATKMLTATNGLCSSSTCCHKYIFVMPTRSGGVTKAQLKKYGNRACAISMDAGPPFVLKDGPSHKIGFEVLTRLGYLNPGLDKRGADEDDAILDFARFGVNERNLANLGFGNLVDMANSGYCRSGTWACFHAALQSRQSFGQWTRAPPDHPARCWLAAQGWIDHAGVGGKVVMGALGSFLNRTEGCLVPRTYSGRIIELTKFLNSVPNRRKDPDQALAPAQEVESSDALSTTPSEVAKNSEQAVSVKAGSETESDAASTTASSEAGMSPSLTSNSEEAKNSVPEVAADETIYRGETVWRMMNSKGQVVKKTESLPSDFSMEFNPDADMIQAFVKAGYLDSPSDPLFPAIAKAFKVHWDSDKPWPEASDDLRDRLSTFSVSPASMALRDAKALIDAKRLLPYNDRGLIFVQPIDLTLEAKQEGQDTKFRTCYSATADPFFITESDSKQAVQLFFLKLGFDDADKHHIRTKALLTAFANLRHNEKTLDSLDFGTFPDSPDEICAKFHAALKSPKCHGRWQTLPIRSVIETILEAEGFGGHETLERRVNKYLYSKRSVVPASLNGRFTRVLVVYRKSNPEQHESLD